MSEWRELAAVLREQFDRAEAREEALKAENKPLKTKRAGSARQKKGGNIPSYRGFSQIMLMQSTKQVRPGWLDRLWGYECVFETDITDGEFTAYGRGPTPEASEKSARRIWDAEVAKLRLQHLH